MKWIPYIAVWLYALLVIGFGIGSIYNPDNAEAVAGGRIPTDIFTIIGIISLYFAYASTKQYFHEEAREKKRFDLLLISVLNIVILIVPIVFFLIFLNKVFGGGADFSLEDNYAKLMTGFIGAFALIILTFYYNVKLFFYNK